MIAKSGKVVHGKRQLSYDSMKKIGSQRWQICQWKEQK